MEAICGIYKISSPSGKVYIGQSRNIKYRWRSYRSKCNKQPALSRSFNKYGIDSHKFDVVIKCIPSKKLLDNLEIFWINYYNSTDSSCGLNCRGGGSRGKLTDVAKEKISKSRIGRFTGSANPFYGRTHSVDTKNKVIESNIKRGLLRSNINNIRSIKVIQLDLNGCFIREFPSSAEIQRVLGFSRRNIAKVCNGTYNQAYGYIWKLKDAV